MKSLPTTVAAILGVLALPVKAEMPRLFKCREFSSNTLAVAANYYIGLGEDRAIKELKILEEDFDASRERGFNRNERIGWVCRIVFNGTEGRPLRPPMYGRLSLPNLTMPLERWPLYPVAESDGVFFVLSEGYELEGLAERSSDYVDYCSCAGTFRKAQVKVPTQEEAIKAFNALRESKRWKMIKWKNAAPGIEYTMVGDLVLRDIAAQATSTPKK